MGFSFDEGKGDGATTVFPFQFTGEDPGYLSEDQVHVYVDSTEVFGFTFPTSNSVELLVAPSDPGAGNLNVLIRRIVDKQKPYSDYARGNIFTQDILNFTFRQQLYALHETLDGFLEEGFFIKSDWDLRDYKILNVGDGSDPTDGINKQQLDDVYDELDGRVDSTELASASAAAALISENASAASAAASLASKSASAISAAAALVSENNAATSAAEALATEGRIETEGDTQVARVISEGDTQVAVVIAQGVTEVANVVTEGDTQDARLQAIVAASEVNKSVRQTMLAGPDLEATPSTIETAATKTGDLTDTYHDLDMDMLTGSRGGMVLTKDTLVGGVHAVQTSIFDNINDYVRTNDTSILGSLGGGLRQLLATGLQMGASGWMSPANLYAFQTTRKTTLDGNEWHYNLVSGFAMCKYEGTGIDFELKHPMGKTPLFWAVKTLDSAVAWVTGRKSSEDFMILDTAAAEASSSNIWTGEPTNVAIPMGNGSNVNTSGDTYFLFGWFGDPLDDLEVGMSGERGVTASYIATGTTTVDTGITDIQMVFNKRIDDTSDWRIRNKAAGFDKYTILNDTDAEVSTGSIVSGSEITLALGTQTHLVIVVGSTADAPDNKLKAGTKLLRKVGTGVGPVRLDLGAAYLGGNVGGMFFMRNVIGATENYLGDTLRSPDYWLLTSDSLAHFADSNILQSPYYTDNGIMLGGDNKTNNPVDTCQYNGFNTTHKATVDGNEWHYNPLTGFAMCKYTGDGIAGRTLEHPMGKKLRIGWFKQLDVIRDWITYHSSLGATKYLSLNNAVAAITASNIWNDTEPDSTTITLGDSNAVNISGGTYIMYGWFGDDLADINTGLTGERGVSAFWQYTGGSGAMAVDTGIDNITGLLYKTSSTTSNWKFLNLNTMTRYNLNDNLVEVAETAYTVEGSVVSWAGGADTVEFIAFGSKADSGVDNDVILPSSISEPTIASMANGFDSVGNIDIIKKLTASQTLNVTGAVGKKFIYMKQDGLLYFTDQRPEYLRDYYPYAKGNHVYDILGAKMYNASGGVESAVFLGECTLDAVGNVYDIFTYAKGDVWESAVFTALSDAYYSFDNPFGHTEELIDVLARPVDDSSFWLPIHFMEKAGIDGGVLIFITDAVLGFSMQERVSLNTSTDQECKYIARRNF